MRKNNMHVYSNNMHSQSQHTTSIKRSGSTDHLGDLGRRSLRSLGVLGVGRTPFPLVISDIIIWLMAGYSPSHRVV